MLALFFSHHLNRRLIKSEPVVCAVIRRPPYTFSNDFSSKTVRMILSIFHIASIGGKKKSLVAMATLFPLNYNGEIRTTQLGIIRIYLYRNVLVVFFVSNYFVQID